MLLAGCMPIQPSATNLAPSQAITLRFAIADGKGGKPSEPYELEFIDQVKTYRAIIGSLSIWERDMPVADAFEAFDGANVDVSLAYPDETSVANVSQIKTYQSPTVTNCVGNTGSKVGGTSVTITGTNFRNVTSVTFGGVAATDVVVNSTTSITCTTPAHEAYPTALVSVEVTNDDGLSGSLAAAFTFTTP
jgi:hypothetical protein